jgi:hypothetical protein
VEEKREEFNKDYKADLDRRKAQREQEKEASREKEVARMMKDMRVGGNQRAQKEDAETVSEAEEEDEDDGALVDRDEDEDVSQDTLQKRYQEALSAGNQMSGEDLSFAKYVQAAGMSKK